MSPSLSLPLFFFYMYNKTCTLQVSELSARLTSKDAEFDEYKQKVISKPESRLQAELTMVHIEKVRTTMPYQSLVQNMLHCHGTP
jgi:hypothetical protein